ncbi:hypothetical protein FE257_010404 [Aspergillus nanangensis]|uniref:non-specific serine/threonine protein kinase n=1 Tax=Aspergillus nanangensis TaxID=2582783 RepID=A0AAD4GS63_ASPNN|nr:hypothetical protein FE257_010404 [Aspergillus nanangensis]
MKVFHFIDLPPEIRRMIWEECLPSRIVEIDGGRWARTTLCDRRKTTIMNRKLPAISQICPESRTIVQENGHWESTPGDCSHIKAWPDPTRDFVFQHWQSFDGMYSYGEEMDLWPNLLKYNGQCPADNLLPNKLGFGGYSTVWLALDTHLKRYVALKVNIADLISREAKVLKALCAPLPSSEAVHPGHDLVTVFLDGFKVQGPNGTHTCYTVTLAQCNLREISFSRLFPLEVARALSYGLTQAGAYTHSRGYVHGDIHLSNVLVKLPSTFDGLSIKQLYGKYGEPETVPVTRCDGEPLPPNAPAKAVVPLFLGKYAEKFSLCDAHPLLSGFGEAFSPASEVRLGQDCQFRAPEAIFEPQAPLTYPSDIWSLTTAIWEIVGMKAIFSTEFVHEDEIIAQHIDVLGPMPSEWWARWEGRSRFFKEDGSPTNSYREINGLRFRSHLRSVCRNGDGEWETSLGMMRKLRFWS